nr:RNA-directed DNA polymerase, eukaryota [Tanacetum cinerariifolium]
MAFSTSYSLIWSTIIKEVNSLKAQGVDLLSHCKVRVGNGLRTSFWNDPWIGDTLLKHLFPRLYALEVSKQVSVAEKFTIPVTGSFHRVVRGGAESHQLSLLTNLLDTVNLSNMEDRWFFDLKGDGRFCVKDVRCLLDDVFLPKADVPTRCDMAKDVMFLVSRWWDLEDRRFDSFQEWLAWFNSIRLDAKSKGVLEGVFYISWLSIWEFQNSLLVEVQKPRKDVIFDDIVLRSFNCDQNPSIHHQKLLPTNTLPTGVPPPTTLPAIGVLVTVTVLPISGHIFTPIHFTQGYILRSLLQSFN